MTTSDKGMCTEVLCATFGLCPFKEGLCPPFALLFFLMAEEDLMVGTGPSIFDHEIEGEIC